MSPPVPRDLCPHHRPLNNLLIANTKQDKPLLIRLAAETDGPRGARIPGGLESDCAL